MSETESVGTLTCPTPDERPDLWPWSASREDGVLRVGGVDLTSVAADFGTPTFVLDVEALRGRARVWASAMAEEFWDGYGMNGGDAFYAGKAFLSADVARLVAAEGLGVDTASLGELSLALRAGVDPDRIGLHGKSFIPMLMGFGCNVPAIMATRTIESHSSRLITILIDPFMSCSARLPVYILLVGTFFSATAGTVLISLYAFGILMAALTAVLLRRGVFKADETPFVMELPPYRMPTVRATLKHMWDKAEQYMRKIGGVILVISIIIWFLSYYPRTEVPTDTTLDPVALSEMQYENSFLGRIGKFCQPLVAPMDFNWKATVALLSGAAAKEVIVSTLGVLYSNADEASLSGTLAASGDFTQRSALAFLIFILLYCPCIASLAAIGNETGNRKWVAFSILYNTGVAWLMSYGVYHLAGLFLSA